MAAETEIQQVTFEAKALHDGLYMSVVPVDGKTITPLKGVLGFWLRDGISREQAKELESLLSKYVESIAFTRG